MSETHVLDASALLCLLKDERGAEAVVAVLGQAVVGAVNLSEVRAKLSDAGGSEQQVARAIDVLHLRIAPFDAEQARIAGTLRPLTRPLGLSLGDRACLALAKQRGATAVTADRAWGDLPEAIGIAIMCIR